MAGRSRPTPSRVPSPNSRPLFPARSRHLPDQPGKLGTTTTEAAVDALCRPLLRLASQPRRKGRELRTGVQPTSRPGVLGGALAAFSRANARDVKGEKRAEDEEGSPHRLV